MEAFVASPRISIRVKAVIPPKNGSLTDSSLELGRRMSHSNACTSSSPYSKKLIPRLASWHEREAIFIIRCSKT